jgi:alkanesulfonate monooxygenase SsuD/methylene tetrahydromethanopterin reductase-like flavin-dependent oxidoreductase (luciferase family)
MKFGIFYELSVPRPWDHESERRVYLNALEQVELADQLGFDYVWAVEHHFTEEYSHCSAPEIFLTACAMRTRSLHVGHGIVICVPQFNHPIKIAERAAVLDILSRGRLELGTGRSATWAELGGFRANPDDTKATWDEFVHCLPKMWTQERYSYEGQFWSMPERAILPKPYQKPHPRMWVAVTSAGTDLDAADRGLGMLGLSYGSIADQEKKLVEYKRRVKNCTPAGEVVNDEASAMSFMYCHEDDEIAVRDGTPIFTTYNALTNIFVMAREARPTKSYPSLGPLATPALKSGAGALDNKVPEGVLVGDPQRILNTVKRYESAGFDAVNFLLTGIESTPQEKILASLRLFAKEVMPHFRRDDPPRQDRQERAAHGAR